LDLSGKKNILIIRLSSLGDILLTTPLIRSIKKKYPDIKIDFILKEQYKELLQFNPYLSRKKRAKGKRSTH
jgi:ADP-heptose:LPS heptosyltransferase